MLDFRRRRRRRGEEVEEGGKRRKEEGTNRYWGEKTQRQKKRTKPCGKTWQDFLLFLSLFFFSFSFLSLFGVGNGLTLNDACQAEWKAEAVAVFRRFGTSRLAQEVKYSSIWGAFLPKLCGKQHNRDYKSLDSERTAIKDEKGTVCRQLLTVWEHLLYYPSGIVQILFRAVMSGDFEAFWWKGEFIVKAEPWYDVLRQGISETTDTTDQIKTTCQSVLLRIAAFLDEFSVWCKPAGGTAGVTWLTEKE